MFRSWENWGKLLLIVFKSWLAISFTNAFNISVKMCFHPTPPPKQKKKDSEAWNNYSYKQAVRKAMFARFKELEW